ncbi:restriction endonuclease subunit S [Leucobacter sp. NPDC015123]|uniref:restriction endonuclease subunit S n=1 Tax=Leucobacter sp. NPDC015123 TaxID=3364129 RepID=UPI0036F4A478
MSARVKVRHVAEVIAGQSPDSEAVTLIDGNGTPFLQGNAEFGSTYPTPVYQCAESRKFAEVNDVLVSVRAPVGAVNVADRRYGIGRGLNAVRAHSVDSRFLRWFLFAQSEYLQSLAVGSTFQAISADQLKELSIEINDVATQREIAGFLDRETAQIDELIAKQELLLDLLAERRQSFISQALTSETGQGTRESGVHWLGEIPASWDLRRFGQVVQIQEGQVDPQDEQYADWLLLAPNHIQKATGRILSLETASEQGASSGKYLANKGAVVYSKIRPRLRKAALAPKTCLISADMYALNADPKLLRNEFLLLLVLSNQFSLFTASSSERVAMPKINRETLAQGWVWYPSLQRQEEILLDVAENNSRVDALAERAAEMIALLKERRQALISAAVTGKIDVTGKA